MEGYPGRVLNLIFWTIGPQISEQLAYVRI